MASEEPLKMVEEPLKMVEEPRSPITMSPPASSSGTIDANQCSLSSSSDPSHISRNPSSSRLNAQAPEFVPRASSRIDLQHPRAVVPPPPALLHMYPNSQFPIPTMPMPMPVNNHHHHNHQVQFHAQPRPPYYVGYTENAPSGRQQSQSNMDRIHFMPSGLPDEVAQKIINQVEYYFSDVNLATTDHLMRFISKDPEGYVPISVVASFRKIKTFTNNHQQLANILRRSSKLVVSEDGKTVKRRHMLTESDMEEIQSRIVLAENLPDDHSHQNLMKIFSSIGAVRSIRTCQPQVANGASSRFTKAESLLFSNKVHAFVEYGMADLAMKAVSELTGEESWRSSLRVRLLLHCTSKPGHQPRVKKPQEEDNNCEEENMSTPDHKPSEESPEASGHDCNGEEISEQGRGRGCGHGRGRGRDVYFHVSDTSSNPVQVSANQVPSVGEQAAVGRQPPGPRMPDGTRGFSAGRGKGVTVSME